MNNLIKIYSHLPLPFHFCLSFLFLLPLLLVNGISLAQSPSEDINALRRRSWSFPAGRGCGRPGTRTRFSAPASLRLLGLGPLFGPLLVSRTRSRPAPFLAVLAAFGVFRPRRTTAPRAAHVDHLQ